MISHSINLTRNVRHYVETWHRARSIYNGVLQNEGIRPLSSKERRRIINYSRSRFGSIAYSPWLIIYTLYRGEFIEGWIPANFFGNVVMPTGNGGYRNIEHARTLLRRILDTDLIPDNICHANGIWFTPLGDTVNPKDVRDLVFHDSETAFLKLEGSSQGRGIIVIDANSFDPDAISRRGNFVIQRAIKQASWFESFSPGSVATLRITTGLLPGGSPRLCAAYLRAGRHGMQYVSSATALRIPIVDTTGQLDAFGADSTWRKYRAHPDTGCVFEGRRVPQFEKALRLCITLHKRLPQFTVVGWDVAITNTGAIEIMEFNTRHPGVKFSEAATGPCFLDFNFERYADLCRQNAADE
jgi:hypothetical protein